MIQQQWNMCIWQHITDKNVALNPQVTEQFRQSLIKQLQQSSNFKCHHFEHLRKFFCWLHIPSYSLQLYFKHLTSAAYCYLLLQSEWHFVLKAINQPNKKCRVPFTKVLVTLIISNKKVIKHISSDDKWNRLYIVLIHTSHSKMQPTDILCS
jgi:hypothetical protein